MNTIEEQIAAEAAAEAAKAEKTAIQIEIGKDIAGKLGVAVTDSRAVSLAIASELGAGLSTLRAVAGASLLARNGEIKLPRGRFANLSRGRGWCRCSDGTFFADHIVGPGKYAVGSSDGFSRKDRVRWTVQHITVGEQTWTTAK